MKPIPKSFFNQPTIQIAKKLLGKIITHGPITAKIVETEAYLSNDPASHSFCGQTPRNSPMFSHPGTSYVYFTYGMYHCFNIVTSKKGCGEAVLIRAVEPITGIEQMKKNRNLKSASRSPQTARRKVPNFALTNGPAKLTIALGITKDLNNINLLDKNSPLKIMQPTKFEKFEIIQTTRIGISKAQRLPHRFYIKNNPFVSKK